MVADQTNLAAWGIFSMSTVVLWMLVMFTDMSNLNVQLPDMDGPSMSKLAAGYYAIYAMGRH